jgi:hypothetical protein
MSLWDYLSLKFLALPSNRKHCHSYDFSINVKLPPLFETVCVTGTIVTLFGPFQLYGGPEICVNVAKVAVAGAETVMSVSGPA